MAMFVTEVVIAVLKREEARGLGKRIQEIISNHITIERCKWEIECFLLIRTSFIK